MLVIDYKTTLRFYLIQNIFSIFADFQKVFFILYINYIFSVICTSNTIWVGQDFTHIVFVPFPTFLCQCTFVRK